METFPVPCLGQLVERPGYQKTKNPLAWLAALAVGDTGMNADRLSAIPSLVFDIPSTPPSGIDDAQDRKRCHLRG